MTQHSGRGCRAWPSSVCLTDTALSPPVAATNPARDQINSCRLFLVRFLYLFIIVFVRSFAICTAAVWVNTIWHSVNLDGMPYGRLKVRQRTLVRLRVPLDPSRVEEGTAVRPGVSLHGTSCRAPVLSAPDEPTLPASSRHRAGVSAH